MYDYIVNYKKFNIYLYTSRLIVVNKQNIIIDAIISIRICNTFIQKEKILILN